MLSDATIARPCAALHRIPKIANELAVAHPKAPDLVQKLFALAKDWALEERRPQPIATAPDESDLVLLLFCPGGAGGTQASSFKASGPTLSPAARI